MKCRVRIVIVSVVVGFILEYNHKYYYYYYHPYPALNNPNPKKEVCSEQAKDKLEDMDISLNLRAAHMGPTLQTCIAH